MEINILYPNESLNYDLTLNCFLKSTDSNKDELIVIANNNDIRHKNKLEAFGIIEKNGQFYFYAIRYESKLVYERIIKGKIGKEYELLSEINSGFWMPKKFIKIEAENLFTYIKDTKLPYRTASKNPMGFTISIGNMLHKKLEGYSIPK